MKISYCIENLFFTISLKIYLDNMSASVAPIDEEKDTRIMALFGSKIMPEVIPNIKATGKDIDVKVIYIKTKYSADRIGKLASNSLKFFKLLLINSIKLI